MKISISLKRLLRATPFMSVVLLCSLAGTAIAQPCNVNATLSKTNPTCWSDCDGSITANVMNGSGQYSYMWSNGGTTAMISSLCAGTYTVMVTDVVSQCTYSASTSILKGKVGGNIAVTKASCGMCNGSIVTTGNGGNGAPYTYAWSNGATTGTINNLCPGTYTVTITDDEGCTFVCTKVVGTTGPGSFTISETLKNDTSCAPGQCSGSIYVTPNPGSAASYMYLWNTGATTAMIGQLCAGNYTVTLTGTNGCTMSETYTIADSSDCGTNPCTITNTLTKTNPSCYGDCDGSITANPANGSGQYMYMWNNGATSATVNNLCSGSYTVTVTDMSTQCTVTTTTSITKGAVGVNITVIDPSCGDCNGSIVLLGNGGNGGPYTYMWNTGATTNSIDSLCPGTYTATITDDEGCTYVCVRTLTNDTSGCADCNDFTTYTQGGWGNMGGPGQYMAANFASCLGGSVTIGDPCGYTITLTSVQDVRDFLPQGGTPAALTQNYTNPGSGNITVLAGQILATHFALMYDACDPNFSGSNNFIGEQIYNDNTSPFYGWNIEAIHDTAMRILSGCTSAYSASDVNDALTAFNENYDNGGDMGWFVCPDNFSVNATPAPVKLANAFPNPFSSSITIDTQDKKGLTVTVADINGKVLNTYYDVSGLLQLTGSFNKGIYIVTVENPADGTRQIIRTICTH